MTSRLSPEEQLKLSAKIYDNSTYIMNGMININTITSCFLEDIINKSIGMCSHLISKKSIQVEIDMIDFAKGIYVDETLILQILYNIIYKIIERLPQEGTIKLRISKSSILHTSALSLSIEDNGYIVEDKDFEELKGKESLLKFKLLSNPLNLNWSEIELLVKNMGGQLTQESNHSQLNRLELKIPIGSHRHDEKSSTSNVVSFRGDHVK